MVPWVSKAQISKLDSLMVNHYKISVIMMMENAGYRMAEFVRLKYPKKKDVLILVGKGNNGGDGLSAARHLLNFGFSPKIFLIDKQLKGPSKRHLEISKKLKIPIFTSIKTLKSELKETKLIYDCLIGYNLKGEPRGKFKDVIDISNNSKRPIIACDVPSGIDTDKGIIYNTHIKPHSILFLSLPKIGCKKIKSKKYVADIGVPKDLYRKIKVDPNNYFKKNSIIKL
ncbi:MAG: NAD(P)H-hydrate epimerase [Candidatus Altiarchaeota archaeon]|nr:NAD(P)H-hydrate epimerase [Candidatus Altiarchaeota archaeon]